MARAIAEYGREELAMPIESKTFIDGRQVPEARRVEKPEPTGKIATLVSRAQRRENKAFWEVGIQGYKKLYGDTSFTRDKIRKKYPKLKDLHTDLLTSNYSLDEMQVEMDDYIETFKPEIAVLSERERWYRRTYYGMSDEEAQPYVDNVLRNYYNKYFGEGAKGHFAHVLGINAEEARKKGDTEALKKLDQLNYYMERSTFDPFKMATMTDRIAGAEREGYNIKFGRDANGKLSVRVFTPDGNEVTDMKLAKVDRGKAVRLLSMFQGALGENFLGRVTKNGSRTPEDLKQIRDAINSEAMKLLGELAQDQKMSTGALVQHLMVAAKNAGADINKPEDLSKVFLEDMAEVILRANQSSNMFQLKAEEQWVEDVLKGYLRLEVDRMIGVERTQKEREKFGEEIASELNLDQNLEAIDPNDVRDYLVQRTLERSGSLLAEHPGDSGWKRFISELTTDVVDEKKVVPTVTREMAQANREKADDLWQQRLKFAEITYRQEKRGKVISRKEINGKDVQLHEPDSNRITHDEVLELLDNGAGRIDPYVANMIGAESKSGTIYVPPMDSIKDDGFRESVEDAKAMLRGRPSLTTDLDSLSTAEKLAAWESGFADYRLRDGIMKGMKEDIKKGIKINPAYVMEILRSPTGRKIIFDRKIDKTTINSLATRALQVEDAPYLEDMKQVLRKYEEARQLANEFKVSEKQKLPEFGEIPLAITDPNIKALYLSESVRPRLFAMQLWERIKTERNKRWANKRRK